MTRLAVSTSLAFGLAATVLAGCAHAPASDPSSRPTALPFIENDFSTAASRAREANLPLFVEVWAPW